MPSSPTRLPSRSEIVVSDFLKSAELDKISGLLTGSVASELRRLELERASWMTAMTQSHSLAEQMKKLVGATSLAAQMSKQAKELQAYSLAEQLSRLSPENSPAFLMAKQWQEAQKTEQESIRRLLEPIQDIRSSLLRDSAIERMLEDLAKPLAASEQLAKLVEQATGSSAILRAMHSDLESSIESARKMLADASVTSGIGQLMKSFEEANKRWIVPQPLLDSLGTLQALQEQMGRLSLPVIDAVSAATLAKVLGPEGIKAQLAAMGINPDGSVNVEFVQPEDGLGLSRKTLELMSLLGFILALLIPLYQELSTSRWQAATDRRLDAQSERTEALSANLEAQRNTIQALTKLVERALVQEAKRQEERFVVRDRVAIVRSKPEHGSAVQGKLLPREVVRPISERGKWIEVEYYHWLHQEHRTGWALKKYFQRVPANFEKPGKEEAPIP
jgi:hypothetical protein